MAISNELLDELLKNYKKPEDLLGEKGILRELRKRLVERAMSAELDNHLGYEKNEGCEKTTENRRNGSSKKTIMTRDEEVEIEVPRDRENSFEPQLLEHEFARRRIFIPCRSLLLPSGVDFMIALLELINGEKGRNEGKALIPLPILRLGVI